MAKGFVYKERLIRFIDPRGKDAWLDRWRLDLYYEPGRAKVHFCKTKEEYERFIRDHLPLVYGSYEKFVRAYKKSG